MYRVLLLSTLVTALGCKTTNGNQLSAEGVGPTPPSGPFGPGIGSIESERILPGKGEYIIKIVSENSSCSNDEASVKASVDSSGNHTLEMGARVGRFARATVICPGTEFANYYLKTNKENVKVAVKGGSIESVERVTSFTSKTFSYKSLTVSEGRHLLEINGIGTACLEQVQSKPGGAISIQAVQSCRSNSAGKQTLVIEVKQEKLRFETKLPNAKFVLLRSDLKTSPAQAPANVGTSRAVADRAKLLDLSKEYNCKTNGGARTSDFVEIYNQFKQAGMKFVRNEARAKRLNLSHLKILNGPFFSKTPANTEVIILVAATDDFFDKGGAHLVTMEIEDGGTASSFLFPIFDVNTKGFSIKADWTSSKAQVICEIAGAGSALPL